MKIINKNHFLKLFFLPIKHKKILKLFYAKTNGALLKMSLQIQVTGENKKYYNKMKHKSDKVSIK
jgi:hypothetical protein